MADCPESMLFYEISIDNAQILSLMADSPESMLFQKISIDTISILRIQNQCFSLRCLLRICQSWAGSTTVQNRCFSMKFLLIMHEFRICPDAMLRAHQFWDCPESMRFHDISIEKAWIVRLSRINAFLSELDWECINSELND